MRISSLRYDNSRRKFSEVQENAGKYTKSKNSDLCSFSRMVKHVEPGNMSREWKNIVHCSVAVISYQSFQPRTPPLGNQSRHQLFKSWIIPCGIMKHIPIP